MSFFQILPVELRNLKKTPQSVELHPEGNVFVHSCMVVDEAAKWKNEIPLEWQKAFMWGMLYHDVGKYAKTNRKDFSSRDHDKLGGHIVEYFLFKYFHNDMNILEKISGIVKTHMRPFSLTISFSGTRAWFKLHNEVPLNVLAYVSMADSDGCGFKRKGKSLDAYKISMKYFKKFGSYDFKKLVTPKILKEVFRDWDQISERITSIICNKAATHQFALIVKGEDVNFEKVFKFVCCSLDQHTFTLVKKVVNKDRPGLIDKKKKKSKPQTIKGREQKENKNGF